MHSLLKHSIFAAGAISLLTVSAVAELTNSEFEQLHRTIKTGCERQLAVDPLDDIVVEGTATRLREEQTDLHLGDGRASARVYMK